MNNKGILNTDPKILFSCFLAGFLEMYESLTFCFLGPIININYFSFLSVKLEEMITYLLFAIGFFFRPIGSLIFGYIGDIYGRKRAVILSISLMCMVSLTMAFLPSYKIGGNLVCWVIVLLRIIQGIAVGGEYSGVTIYAIENTNENSINNVIGTIIMAGGIIGILFATIISKSVLHLLPPYGWRFAFLFSFSLAIIGYYVRSKLIEKSLFIKNNNKNKLPLLHGLKFFRKQFLASFLLAGANNSNFYFILIFLPAFLKTWYPNSIQFDTLVFTTAILILLPLAGLILSRLSSRKILLVISICFVVYQNLLLPSLALSSIEIIGYIHIIISTILIISFASTTNIFIMEQFPTNCRFSCGALSYSLGSAMLGSTTPFVCAYIISIFGPNPYYLGYYMSFLSLLGLIGILSLSPGNHKSRMDHCVNVK